MSISETDTHWLYSALKQVDFLNFCSIGEIEQLAENLTRKHFTKDDTIVREGDKGDYLFLLYQGQVSITSHKKEITRLGPGNYFGEMALVSHEPRTATVTAITDIDAFLLYSTDFRKLLEKNDDLARNVEQHIARRKADRELELRRRYVEGSRGVWGSLKRLFGR